MTDSAADPGATVLDRLVEALARASRHSPGVEEAPAALLWPDGEEQWRPLLPRLRARLPQLLTLGPYDPEARTGPAIWIKCVLAGTLPEAKLLAGEVPVVYLPGVARQTLRAGEECPRSLQPLVELLYRGAEPQRDRADFPWFYGSDDNFHGERHNDHHRSLEEKRRAREAKAKDGAKR